jgi:hypothetical protein
LVIINDCPIAVGVGDVVECAANLITWVRLVSPILAVVEICLAGHPKFVWFSTPTAMGQ